MDRPFQSPFDDLGNTPEVVTGSMQCFKCFDNVTKGLYDKKQRVLVYVCEQGHKNVLEDYILE